MSPGVPRSLLLHFLSISGSIWASFFRCFPKQRKFTKTYKKQCIFNDFASQIPLFFDLFFIDFSCFVRNPSWRAFLAPKTPTYTPKVDLWNPFGFLGIPKMTFGASILSQKAPKAQSPALGGATWSRPCAPWPPKPPQGHHFFNLGLILVRFLRKSPHISKTKFFLILVFYVCVFFYFVKFVLIFGCPFPPLSQIGPICARFWFHFVRFW